MKTYLKLLLVFLSAITANRSYAQFILLKDATGGGIIFNKDYVDINGSPFFKAEWLNGTVTLADARVIKDINVKYDEVVDKPYVRGPQDQTVLLNDKVTEFSMIDNTGSKTVVRKYKNGFTNIPGFTVDSYFEVLADGKVSFLKKKVKVITEDKQYNSAVITKGFFETTKYYIVSNINSTLVKKDKNSVLAALSDKQTELDAFVKANSLNLKDEDDIVKLVDYYNTL